MCAAGTVVSDVLERQREAPPVVAGGPGDAEGNVDGRRTEQVWLFWAGAKGGRCLTRPTPRPRTPHFTETLFS